MKKAEEYIIQHDDAGWVVIITDGSCCTQIHDHVSCQVMVGLVRMVDIRQAEIVAGIAQGAGQDEDRQQGQPPIPPGPERPLRHRSGGHVLQGHVKHCIRFGWVRVGRG